MRLNATIATLRDLPSAQEMAAPEARRITWIQHSSVAVSLFVCTLLFQRAGGAFTNEYGGFPDEPAHFVTALMVHDYVLSGEWSDPMGFARTFYAHYPKVGLGHWPPVFYMALAAWMIVFGTSTMAVMLFIATTTATVAWLLYRILVDDWGLPLASAAAIYFLALPLVQQYGAMVMMESAMAVLMLLAVWIYAKYLDCPSWRRGALFGIVATTAILTKGTAIALCAIPPLVVLPARRFDLLKRFSFWLPGLVVGLLCTPWYVITLRLQQNGMTQAEPSLAFTIRAFGYYTWHLLQIGGVGLGIASLVGMIISLNGKSGDEIHKVHFYRAAGACLIGILSLQSLVPVMPDARHLIPAAPLLILFGIRGITVTAGHFARFGNSKRLNVTLLAVTVAALFLTEKAELPRKHCRGFASAIESIVSDPAFKGATILVSSNSAGEGVAVAEVARRDRRPGHIVTRASQIFSRSGWDGSGYTAYASTPAEVIGLLDQHNVRLILLDDSTPDYPQYRHHSLLVQSIRTCPDRFQLEGTSPVTGQNPTREGMLRVYRLTRDDPAVSP